jgi:hypothetical protein
MTKAVARQSRREWEAAWEARELRIKELAGKAKTTPGVRAELAALRREHAADRARLIERLGYPAGCEPQA